MLSSQEITAKMMLNNNALRNPDVSNPGTIQSHNNTIRALITNENRPNVATLTGNVINFTIGRITALIKPKTILTIIATYQGLIVTLDIIHATNSTAIVCKISLLIISFFCFIILLLAKLIDFVKSLRK